MTTAKFRLTFLESVLGTAPNDDELYSKYIASKAPDAETIEDEIAAIGVDEVTERGITVFPRDTDGTPILWNYQIEGFFKSACGFLYKVEGTKSSKIRAYKKTIDGRVFVGGEITKDNLTGRKIRIHDAFPMGLLQRPLRAQTPQGERVSLACSEEIPAGAWVEFTVKCYVDSDMDAVREWLDFGTENGLCQWRNSGHGRFYWDELEGDEIVGGNGEVYRNIA